MRLQTNGMDLLVAQLLKNPPAVQEGSILRREDPLEKG